MAGRAVVCQALRVRGRAAPNPDRPTRVDTPPRAALRPVKQQLRAFGVLVQDRAPPQPAGRIAQRRGDGGRAGRGDRAAGGRGGVSVPDLRCRGPRYAVRRTRPRHPRPGRLASAPVRAGGVPGAGDASGRPRRGGAAVRRHRMVSAAAACLFDRVLVHHAVLYDEHEVLRRVGNELDVGDRAAIDDDEVGPRLRFPLLSHATPRRSPLRVNCLIPPSG